MAHRATLLVATPMRSALSLMNGQSDGGTWRSVRIGAPRSVDAMKSTGSGQSSGVSAWGRVRQGLRPGVIALLPAEGCGLDAEPFAEPMRGRDRVGGAAEFDHRIDRGEAVLAAEVLDALGMERDVLLEVWPARDPCAVTRQAPVPS